MFRKSTAVMVLSASVLASPVLVLAQQAQPVQPGQAAQPVRPGVQVQVNPNRTAVSGQAAAPVSEHALAACVAIANQEEVAIAKIAQEKSKNKEVKEFAKMLADDHEAFLKKLQKFAPEAQESLQTSSSSQQRVQPAGGTAQAQPQQAQAQAQPGQPVQQVAGYAPGHQLDVIQLHREVAQQCIADATKKMNDKDGEKFDFCYIGHQIAKHEEMKTKLTVFQRHASGEFAQLLASGIETTDSHLKKAEKIMKDLEHDHDKSGKRDSDK